MLYSTNAQITSKTNKQSFHHRGYAVVLLIISPCCITGMYIMYLLVYNSLIRQTSRVRQFYHCFKSPVYLFCISLWQTVHWKLWTKTKQSSVFLRQNAAVDDHRHI